MGSILVTGAAGYVGSAVVHALSRMFNPPKVIGLDNLSTGHTCPLPTDFTCYHGEVGHKLFVRNLIEHHKVRQIVHCAAKVVVPESVERPMEYYQNNVTQSMSLIETAVDCKLDGFVFASTAAVYGTPELGDRPIYEDDATRPCSPYGHSKLMIEQYLRDVHEVTGMNTVVLRYFNVAGADPLGQYGPRTESGSHLIPRVVRAALGSIPKVLVYGDGLDKRDYVHVADVAQANVKALEWNAHEVGFATLNVGTGVGTCALDVLDLVQDLTGLPVPRDMAQRREGDPATIIAGIKRIGAKFNWRPQYDLKQIVEHAVAWERKKLPPR